MTQRALDFFGELLMTQVRDRTISNWDAILKGRMKAPDSQLIHKRISETFDESQLELFHELIPEIVDTVMFNLLYTLESEENVNVEVKTDTETVSSIREVSDGLPGELYTEDGWIAQFSKERYRLY